MISTRSFLIRLVAAGAGTVFLGALLFVGLGWALSTTQIWLFNLLERKRWDWLHVRYDRISAAVWAGDRDGDGVRDVAEMFHQTDPADPADHPRLSCRVEPSYFQLIDIGVDPDGRGPFFPNYHVVLRPGARIRVTGRLYAYEEPLRPGRGLQLRLTSSETTQLGLPGAAVSGNPITVPVDDGGAFTFDAHFPMEAIGTAGQEGVSVQILATGERLNDISVCRVWPKLVQELIAEKVAPGELTSEEASKAEGPGELIRLRFPPVPEKDGRAVADAILVEGAHDRDGADWVPIHIHDSTASTCVLKRLDGDDQWSAPIKFRWVPPRDGPRI